MLLYVSLLFNGICILYFFARAIRSTRDASIQVDEDWEDSSDDDTNTTLQKLHISLTPPATPSPKKLLSNSPRSYDDIEFDKVLKQYLRSYDEKEFDKMLEQYLRERPTSSGHWIPNLTQRRLTKDQ